MTEREFATFCGRFAGGFCAAPTQTERERLIFCKGDKVMLRVTGEDGHVDLPILFEEDDSRLVEYVLQHYAYENTARIARYDSASDLFVNIYPKNS